MKGTLESGVIIWIPLLHGNYGPNINAPWWVVTQYKLIEKHYPKLCILFKGVLDFDRQSHPWQWLGSQIYVIREPIWYDVKDKKKKKSENFSAKTRPELY